MPNKFTFLVVIKGVFSACVKKLDLGLVRWLHLFLESNGIRKGLTLCNAILDMYTWEMASLRRRLRCLMKCLRGVRRIWLWLLLVLGLRKVGNVIRIC
ncbi:uncharacterized protein LOC141672077 isoform X2 [Apium graveolens]|uniref:uncharacterized protein LOC141672077 isoform X2 n=1 Tax=Apium graveolens TaxID=4045 RepID=UPI003D7B86EB